MCPRKNEKQQLCPYWTLDKSLSGINNDTNFLLACKEPNYPRLLSYHSYLLWQLLPLPSTTLYHLPNPSPPKQAQQPLLDQHSNLRFDSINILISDLIDKHRARNPNSFISYLVLFLRLDPVVVCPVLIDRTIPQFSSHMQNIHGQQNFFPSGYSATNLFNYESLR